jgi:hypothetical protein
LNKLENAVNSINIDADAEDFITNHTVIDGSLVLSCQALSILDDITPSVIQYSSNNIPLPGVRVNATSPSHPQTLHSRYFFCRIETLSSLTFLVYLDERIALSLSDMDFISQDHPLQLEIVETQLGQPLLAARQVHHQ